MDSAVAWRAVQEHVEKIRATHLRNLLKDKERNQGLSIDACDIFFDASRQIATLETKRLLLELAAERNVEGQKAAMFAGEKINTTEGRPVLHTALRAPRDQAVMVDGVNVIEQVYSVLDKIESFSNSVRQGSWTGATGKPLRHVVAVGIGGSYLGPEFVYEALRTEPAAKQKASGRTLSFLANVDPVDFSRSTACLDPEETLVVVVSKTFTTAETMLNAKTMRQWLIDGVSSASPDDVVSRHMIACSSATEKVAAFGIDPNNIFEFWDWVGGRFSVHSAVGMVPLSLHYGFDTMRSFLDGAHEMDRHFLSEPLEQNMPTMLGLFGVWNSTFLGYSARAVLPYSQALVRLPAHLQQLEMESNGKGVSVDGKKISFGTGEIIFGEPGTNGQHSFYQLMHQGRVIPAEFIGACRSHTPIHISGEEVNSHDELMSNFFAQPDALAIGKTQQECAAEGDSPALQPHKEFTGNRPSISILLQELSPRVLGQILALYEHRVAVQGFIWGINSFDQWGVQLGKVLAKEIRAEIQKGREGLSPSSTNSSTGALLSHYLAPASM